MIYEPISTSIIQISQLLWSHKTFTRHPTNSAINFLINPRECCQHTEVCHETGGIMLLYVVKQYNIICVIGSGKTGLICTRSEIHYNDGYNCYIPFYTGKQVQLDGQTFFSRWLIPFPVKCISASSGAHEVLQSEPVDI